MSILIEKNNLNVKENLFLLSFAEVMYFYSLIQVVSIFSVDFKLDRTINSY